MPVNSSVENNSIDSDELIEIYASQGKLKLRENDIDQACFFFTNAMVIALEAGDARAEEYHALLVQNGREQP